MLFDQDKMSEVQWSAYCYIYECLIDKLEPQQATAIDGIIYIDVPPQVCFDRLTLRNRTEEENRISLEYLIKLDNYYKAWLNKCASNNIKIIKIDNSDNHQISEIIKQILLTIK